jgi:hypothetical protein
MEQPVDAFDASFAAFAGSSLSCGQYALSQPFLKNEVPSRLELSACLGKTSVMAILATGKRTPLATQSLSVWNFCHATAFLGAN